jgi:hypothetical protein
MLLNREAFNKLAVNLVKKHFPEYTFKNFDAQKSTVELEKGGAIQYVGLSNAWTNYQRTSNINVLDDLLEGIQQAFGKQFLPKEGNVEDLMPVIRPQGFNKKEMNGQRFTAVHSPIAEGIEMLLVFNSPKFVSFAMENTLPQGYDPARVKVKGIENLFAKGWQSEAETENLPYGTLYFYFNGANPFTAQFLFPEMYEDKIGKSFHISFPSYDSCCVLKLHQHVSSDSALKTLALHDFRAASYKVYEQLQSPLVPFVYEVSDGNYSRVK